MLATFMLLVAPSVLVATPVPAVAVPAMCQQQDETVRDFRKYFKKAKETWERVEYIQALKGIEDPLVSRLLLPLTQDDDAAVSAAAVEVLAALPTPESRSGMLKVLEKGKPKDDVPFVLQAAGMGPWAEFAELSREYLTDKKDQSRLWAAVGAARYGDIEALPTLATMAVDDDTSACRVAAIDGLRQMGVGHEDVAGPPLVASLLSDDLSAQTAACLALRTVRVREAITPLVDLLENGEGRILSDVYPTLLELTDLQFLDDPSIWRNWWNRASETYVLPSLEEIQGRRAARKKTNELYKPSRKSGSFAGVETPSHNMVFVIDVSGSMEQFVVDRDEFRKQGFTRFEKIEVVRRQVVQAIESLEPYVKFNVIAFASETEKWRKKIAPANSLNKKSALEFVRDLKPIGGAAAAALAQAGMSGSAGVDKGRTNTFGALCAALGVSDEEAIGVTAASLEAKTKVDTIFFLSDGIPSVGHLVDPNDIAAAIRELNRFRRVVIHTVAIGDFQKDFMVDLATDNGGIFKDLGR